MLLRRAEGRGREVGAVAGLEALLGEDDEGKDRAAAAAAAAVGDAATAGPRFLWIAWLLGLLT